MDATVTDGLDRQTLPGRSRQLAIGLRPLKFPVSPSGSIRGRRMRELSWKTGKEGATSHAPRP